MSITNIDAAEFERLTKQSNHVILDVRSPQELVEGSIPGHVMINMFDPFFLEKINQLEKSKTYLVYCRSGNRSRQACEMMSGMGFNDLYNLSGGIGAWNAQAV